MQSSSTDLFPLSWLSQYGYCPRRLGLLALDCEWSDNIYTASGSIDHKRVHTARIERKNDKLLIYGQAVFSRDLGVNGFCDCVEAYPSESGVSLPYADGRYDLYPIEYKHGVLRNEEEYNLQLCAQAICLEERFGCSIKFGAVFYTDSHRRQEVRFTSELRQKVSDTSRAIVELLEGQTLPRAVYSAKCKKCSMVEICRPQANVSARPYCSQIWQDLLEVDET